MGMGKREIDRKFDDIVEFSGIGEFLDSPVKHYSSGMYVRLGFSVAVHCEPKILLIDEVLAVGDINFQNKCLRVISNFLESGETTIVFVSHDMNAMRLLCKRCILLENGVLTAEDAPEKVIERYTNSLSRKKGLFDSDIMSMRIVDRSLRTVSDLDCKGAYSIVLDFKNIRIDDGLVLAMRFKNLESRFSYRLETERFFSYRGSLSGKRIFINFDELNLPVGSYTIGFAISDGNYIKRKHYFDETIFFNIREGPGVSNFLTAKWSEEIEILP